MAKRGKSRRRPAVSEDGREQQLVSQAMDLAEQQMRDGTASAQVITHYLKLGSSRERLEQAKLRNEDRLLEAKVDALASAQRIEELYGRALSAMRLYQGDEPIDTEDVYDDGYD